MRLYEIAEQFRALDSLIPDVESEQDAQAYTELYEGLTGTLQEKVHGLCCVIRNTESEANAFDAEIKRLQAKKKALESKVASLSSYLEYQLKGADQSEVKTALFTVKFQINPDSVEILDEKMLPIEFTRSKVEPDKTVIKEALKRGEYVPGAKLVRKERMVIK